MTVPTLTPLATAVLHVSRSPERVLAIGCGEGEPALFLAREFPTARVRGVDPSEGKVRAATARIGLDREGRIAFKVGRPRSLPFPEGFFDLVVQLEGRPAFAEIVRVLRPGGYLILARLQPRRAMLGLGGKPPLRSLARHGFALLETSAVGDGSFSVARLRDPGETGGGD